MKTNVKVRDDNPPRTAEGAVARRISPELELRRSVMACMLWEDAFYEDGVSIAQRIEDLVGQVDGWVVKDIAIEARTKMKLRHVPLLLARKLVSTGHPAAASTLTAIIQRPDEITEFLSLYWKDGRTPIANSVKRGLAAAFEKFDEYQLAKYDRDEKIKLRDVMFLVHARTKDIIDGPRIGRPAKAIDRKGYKRGKVRRHPGSLADKVVTRTLMTPDTWEVQLSEATSPQQKREVWMGLLQRNMLGALALLRNLRNMQSVGVPDGLIRVALGTMKTERVLPFRFITAAKYAPGLEPHLEAAMLRALGDQEKLPGKTVLIVDVSGSMQAGLSGKSEMTRVDAACALAMLTREVCEDVAIYATAGSDMTRIHRTALVAPRHGMALRDAIRDSMMTLGGGGIFLAQVCQYVFDHEGMVDRVIVFTDEQDCDLKLTPANAKRFGKHNYLLNVSVEKNGIGYKPWTHIDGFSEATIDFIREAEKPAPDPQAVKRAVMRSNAVVARKVRKVLAKKAPRKRK